MATNNNSYHIVNQILDNLYENQSKKREKANTIVSVIGLIITVVISTIGYLIENYNDSIPTWVPALVPILGFAATALGISRTKNGITKGILEEANTHINSMIDEKAEGTQTGTIESSKNSMNIAQQLEELAQSYVNK